MARSYHYDRIAVMGNNQVLRAVLCYVEGQSQEVSMCYSLMNVTLQDVRIAVEWS